MKELQYGLNALTQKFNQLSQIVESMRSCLAIASSYMATGGNLEEARALRRVIDQNKMLN